MAINHMSGQCTAFVRGDDHKIRAAPRGSRRQSDIFSDSGNTIDDIMCRIAAKVSYSDTDAPVPARYPTACIGSGDFINK